MGDVGLVGEATLSVTLKEHNVSVCAGLRYLRLHSINSEDVNEQWFSVKIWKLLAKRATIFFSSMTARILGALYLVTTFNTINMYPLETVFSF